MFTACLLDALQAREAREAGSGALTVNSLAAFVEKRISLWNRDNPEHSQHPDLHTEGAARFLITD